MDDQRLALAAARGGVGWADVYEAMASADLQAGRLVQSLADWCPPEPGFQLYYPGRRQVSPALRAFIDWLRPEPAGWFGIKLASCDQWMPGYCYICNSKCGAAFYTRCWAWSSFFR